MTISVYRPSTDSDNTAESQHAPVMFQENKKTRDAAAAHLCISFWHFIQKYRFSDYLTVKC